MEIIEDQDEGWFVISYPDLPGCITCGETIESAMQNAKDAKREWIRAALEEGIEIYEPDSLENSPAPSPTNAAIPAPIANNPFISFSPSYFHF